MFVGHYGVSFAAKSIEKNIPLWLLFIAVQFVDVLWAILVLAGIEKVTITPGITATNPLDLYYMPYTHSLLGSVCWAGVGFIAYKLIRRSPASSALVVAAAIFSHWILDLIVHRPDLPLYDNSHKLGLGLWNHPVLALMLEAGLLFGGILLYLRTNPTEPRVWRISTPVFGLLLLGVQLFVFFGSPPTSPAAAAITALASYVLFAAISYWLERKAQVSDEL
jgi:membrane-bound metal-dependent hydrolase YbcI (DUF457 family)